MEDEAQQPALVIPWEILEKKNNVGITVLECSVTLTFYLDKALKHLSCTQLPSHIHFLLNRKSYSNQVTPCQSKVTVTPNKGPRIQVGSQRLVTWIILSLAFKLQNLESRPQKLKGVDVQLGQWSQTKHGGVKVLSEQNLWTNESGWQR